MILAGFLGCLFASSIVEDHLGITSADLFVQQYSMQLFGVVFGYIAVARLNVSYNRYWEGITHIKGMQSKWSDACGQTIAFDRIGDHRESAGVSDPWCVHVARLFMQLSAVASLTLHLEPDELDSLWSKIEADLPKNESATTSARFAAAQNHSLVTRRWQQKGGDHRPFHDDWLRRCLARIDALIHPPKSRQNEESSGSFSFLRSKTSANIVASQEMHTVAGDGGDARSQSSVGNGASFSSDARTSGARPARRTSLSQMASAAMPATAARLQPLWDQPLPIIDYAVHSFELHKLFTCAWRARVLCTHQVPAPCP